MNKTHAAPDFIEVDLVPMPPPSAANREFRVKVLDEASRETREIIENHGNDYILKHRSFSPSKEKYLILLLAKTDPPEAFWIPEDEVLLLTKSI